MPATNYKGEPVYSDVKWYCERCSGEPDIFYGIFFDMCREFNVQWSKATPYEKLFIEAITRFKYAQNHAERMGLPTDDIKLEFNLDNVTPGSSVLPRNFLCLYCKHIENMVLYII